MYQSAVPEALKKVGTITFVAEYAQNDKALYEFRLPVKRMYVKHFHIMIMQSPTQQLNRS